jgi:hypothetical protein
MPDIGTLLFFGRRNVFHELGRDKQNQYDGRAPFQLYSRSVPAIKEISILDGFVKWYDLNRVGYLARRDILLRVSGVMLHSLGKLH